jgi:FtsP/CotA-like multicopper oxidase with cupredoxin domain
MISGKIRFLVLRPLTPWTATVAVVLLVGLLTTPAELGATLGRCQPEEYTSEPPPVDPDQLPLCQPLATPFTTAGLDEGVDTELVVRFVKRWVPVWENNDWAWKTLILRGYGLPIDPGKPTNPDFPADPTVPITDYYDTDTNLQWVQPGPTLQLRKGTAEGSGDGSRLRINLRNRLPALDYHEGHKCNPTFYCAGEMDADGNVCSGYTPEECEAHPPCEKTPVPQEPPDCFHGNNVTNLHYHGSHVSPQAHQDYVLVSLFPKGSTNVPSGEEDVALADYQTDIHPFPWNQAEGTHWYHAHKHGSTALQMLNGMAGGLLIEGPFDDWLEDFFCRQHGEPPCARPALEEKVLVVNQLWGIDPDDAKAPELNLFNEKITFAPGHPLVNGQADPVVTMSPGEIQRWRFIGATMQASAHLEIGFEEAGAPELRQIAQDGVQFSRDLYTQQPYRDQDGTFSNFDLAPGNRVDLLVQAPDEGGKCFYMTHRLLGNLAEGTKVRELVMARQEAAAKAVKAQNPALLTVCITGPDDPMKFPCAEGESGSDCSCPPEGPCWYDEPYKTFLRDVAEVDKKRTVIFGMTGDKGFGAAGGTKPATPNCFYLGNPDLPYAQYDGSCVLESMKLSVDGVGERWKVTNTCPTNNCPNHPFHIHINPFQLVSAWGTVGGAVVSDPDHPDQPKVYDPPIWQDTVALPYPHCDDTDAGPIWNNDDAKEKCPGVCAAKGDGWEWNGQWTTTVEGQESVCGCCRAGFVEIRHRFEDYTGAYVTHCHILGHEDRGMMQNLQTVCADGSYGTPVADGGADDCGEPIDPLPVCTDPPTCPVSSMTEE